MPAGQPFGLFHNDALVWHFKSRIHAFKGIGVKMPREYNNTKFEIGKYFIQPINQDQVKECHVDDSLFDQVQDIVSNNKPWTIQALSQPMHTCHQCKESKPFTKDHFHQEGQRLRGTCIQCRNKGCQKHAAKKKEQVKTKTTFTCSGYGVNEPHEAPVDQHFGDRDVCKACYNAKRKQDYDRMAEPGAILKLRERLTGQTAECSKCGETKDIGLDFVMRIGGRGYKSHCLKCDMAAGRHIAYRKRQREIDEQAFLRHNAEVLRKWRANNPESDERWRVARRQDANVRIQAIIRGASTRGISFKMDDLDKMKVKLSQPCAYCGHFDKDGDLNGLDRVINTHGYSDANTVSCCHICNLIKHTNPLDDFIRTVCNIASHHDDISASTTLPQTKFDGTAPLSVKHKHKEQADAFKSLYNNQDDIECYLCGISRLQLRGQEIGVDRIDSSIGYQGDNCMPCCSACNYAKKDFQLDEFLGHIQRMACHLATFYFDQSSVPDDETDASATLSTSVKRRKPIQHVPHARAVGIKFINSATGNTDAWFLSIASASQALGIKFLSKVLAEKGYTIHHWKVEKVDASQLGSAMDPESLSLFKKDFVKCV
ncbi:hypothetical protein BCR44DRAFT_47165 [Catenaria anguillulae PL171]|uniref:Uncharacterized protein n=1 Tax=Catenaria anguillulae PL171 TaxID=765915 RepID=A0A1Y2H5V2_9FUNG|nr:hypothetical protein BCR44DRAFT_47165 [Catenaria anguillulae PL171]